MDAIIPKRLRGPYRTTRCAEPPPEALLAGIHQFNQREFFEQHETLEALWRSEPDDVRYLYQGILQVGVGFHHLLRGNYHGAVSKLESGIAKLKWFEPECQGVDVRSLVLGAAVCLETLQHLGRDRLTEFDLTLVPTVRVTLSPGGRVE